MLIIGRVGVFLLSLFLAFTTTEACAQVDVERLAKRLEKLEAENDALKQRLRRLERVEAPAKVSMGESLPAVVAPVAPVHLKQAGPEAKPFEGAYAMAFGSLVSGNLDLLSFQPAPSSYVANTNYANFNPYPTPQQNMRSKGFGMAIGYNIPISNSFLFGVEARATLPQWSRAFRWNTEYNMQFPSPFGSCSGPYGGCGSPVIPSQVQIGQLDSYEDRFKIGADYDISFRPGLVLSNTLLFGRFGFGIQKAEQKFSQKSTIETCSDPKFDNSSSAYSYSVILNGCSASQKDVTSNVDIMRLNFPYLLFGLGVEQDLGPVFLRIETDTRTYFKADKLTGVRMSPGLVQRINAGVGVHF